MAFISVNGTELYYELSGDGDVPLALVHGSWGDHTNWNPVVGELARSFRVLRYDRRGHSQSARPKTQGSLHEDAMDLAALLEALDLGPAHVVGNSGGGAVSLWLAAERPEMLRSLTVHEPPLFGLLAEDAASAVVLRAIDERITNVFRLLREGNFRNAARHFVDNVAFGPGSWDKLPQARQATFVNNAPTFLDELQDPKVAIVDLDALGRFDRPTLLTRGEHSPPFFPAVVGKIARAMPSAAEFVFRGAAHVPHVSHPAEFVDQVSSFILRHESPRPSAERPAKTRN
jgi:pimeloyl-ACP methyl ester carboxylesterase